MAINRKTRTVGSSSFPITAHGASSHNFERIYYKSKCSAGDVRGVYMDCEFASTGSGETLRLRGIASGTLAATGGTINALHATGRVASGGTVSGALNAIRATLEVGGTTPTPGGRLSVLQLDSNIAAGATIGSQCAFISVTESGTADLLTNFINLPAPGAKNSGQMFVARHADCTAGYALKAVDDAGTAYYFMLTTDTPAD